MPIQFEQFLEEGHKPEKLAAKERKNCPLHSSRKQTRTQCRVCKVGLCDMICFAKWHFDEDWNKKF